MIQQIIESQGWQQFISAGEVTAVVAALLTGWGLTETLKRIAYQAGGRVAPGWVWPALGFLVTLAAAVMGWPANGIFPHRWIAAIAIAASSPTIYWALIFTLRRLGYGGLASKITGNRRERPRC